MRGVMRRVVHSGGGRRRNGVRPAVERLEGRELPAAVVPLPVTGLVAAGDSASSVALSWNASPDPSVTGYDVTEEAWVSNGGGKGSHGGHYVYTTIATGLTTPSCEVTGVAPGYHTYFVNAVNPVGVSLDSYLASARPWSAPTLLYGPTYYQLSDGYEAYGPVAATAGRTTQLTFYVGGSPLSYSIVSAPPNVSIDPHTGVMTFKPSATEVGTFSATYQATNALGSVQQTVQFVVSPAPNLPAPTLKLVAGSAAFSGQVQGVTATAVGTDGVTPVSGTFAYAYNGSATTPPYRAGTYPVLVTFTSSDPNYRGATLLTKFTVTQDSPAFHYLSSPAIAVGAAYATVSGSLSARNGAIPAGDYVIVTIDGASVAAPVSANATFTTAFPSSWLPVGTYTVSYAFAGDSNFRAALTRTTTLAVDALQAPVITLQPADQTTSAPDGVTFTAAAKGSPGITVQWQVSTDGGVTFSNVTGNASALTTALSFTSTSAGMSGYEYRAVFTNSAGATITRAALLTLEPVVAPFAIDAVVLPPSGERERRAKAGR